MRAKGCGPSNRVIQRLYEILKYCDSISSRFIMFASFIFTLLIMKNNNSTALSVQLSDTTDVMIFHKPCKQFSLIQKFDLFLPEHLFPLLQIVRQLIYLLYAFSNKLNYQHVISIDRNNINAVTLLIQVLSQYFIENTDY